MAGCSANVSTPAMKVMTFNIRHEKSTDDHPWQERKEGVIDIIEKTEPHIIGFQEVTSAVYDDLNAALSDRYDSYGVLRDQKENSEMTPIFIRKDSLMILDKGSFWLSEHCDQSGSIGWDAKYPRVASWVLIGNRSDRKPRAVAINTHFDHKGIEAQPKSGLLIAQQAKELRERFDVPIIISGDFNSSPVDMSMKNIWDSDSYTDSYHALSDSDREESITAHDYTGRTRGKPIDYIMTTRPYRIERSEIVRMQYGGQYPSDHFPVLVEIGEDEMG